MITLKEFYDALSILEAANAEFSKRFNKILGAMEATIAQQQDTPPKTNTSQSSKCTPAVLPTMEDEVKKYKGKSITKRKDGRWYARFRDHGKQRTVYGRTQNECYEKLKLALRQLEKGEKQLQAYTLGEWIPKWLELYKVNKLKAATLEQMQRYLRDVTPIANKSLKKLTSIDIQIFLNTIDKPRKREKLYEFLKDALTKAVKNKLITDNPIEAVERPKIKRKQSRAMTKEEETIFIEACRQSNQGKLYLLCLYQGLRLGEALALTYEDIDFVKGKITVNKSIDTLGELTTPKTETSNRVLPLFKKTAALLDPAGKGNIFKSPRKVYQNSMAKICHRLNFEGISIHSLRHTFATRCAEAGVAAKVVQKWLGHSTLDMTLNVYTHVNEDFEAEMTTKIDAHFDAQSN